MGTGVTKRFWNVPGLECQTFCRSEKVNFVFKVLEIEERIKTEVGGILFVLLIKIIFR